MNGIYKSNVTVSTMKQCFFNAFESAVPITIKEIQCIQYKHDDKRCPVLPPDNQECIQRGARHRIQYKNAYEARMAYQIGMKMRNSRYKHRRYLRGAFYNKIFMENANVIDVKKYGGVGVNLNIAIGDGKTSVLKVRDLSHEVEALGVVKSFSECCNKDSKVRSSSGDCGSMFAFGLRDNIAGDYVSMKDSSMDIENYNVVSRKLLEKYFYDDLKQIIEADRKQGIIPPKMMGGIDGISAYCIVSRDLINAAHFDLDTSVGLSIFNERIPGLAKKWNFVLPNTIIDGENIDKAVVIKLFDGCALSWDGRVIFHCTSTEEVGEGNHLYGNYWGGKVFR